MDSSLEEKEDSRLCASGGPGFSPRSTRCVLVMGSCGCVCATLVGCVVARLPIFWDVVPHLEDCLGGTLVCGRWVPVAIHGVSSASEGVSVLRARFCGRNVLANTMWLHPD
jgi:hypothetical protein